LLRANGVCRAQRADLEAHSVWVEVGEVALAAGLGVRLLDLGHAEPVREVARVRGAGEAAGQRQQQGRQQRVQAEPASGLHQSSPSAERARPATAAKEGVYAGSKGDARAT